VTTILDTLADAARERVAQARETLPLEELREEARAMPRDARPSFKQALSGLDPLGDSLHFICECKKASPSKGLIAPEFPYQDIAREYEAAGASAISVLTEPTRFLGRDEYLRDIAATVSLPCIRKDFTIDEYQIYEAKTLGASAVLLICSLLDTATIHRYLGICDELGLSALVETHDEAELAGALAAGAKIVGINNRNLKDFSVDIGLSLRLRDKVPPEVIFVAESGIHTADDVAALRQHGVNAVLIGEQLMRATNKQAALAELKGDFK
jgi:indole-3-glycerol phosphate synthase